MVSRGLHYGHPALSQNLPPWHIPATRPCAPIPGTRHTDEPMERGIAIVFRPATLLQAVFLKQRVQMVTSNITHLEECAVKLCIGNSKNSRDTLSSTAFPTFCQYCFLQRGNNKLPFLTSPKQCCAAAQVACEKQQRNQPFPGGEGC